MDAIQKLRKEMKVTSFSTYVFDKLFEKYPDLKSEVEAYSQTVSEDEKKKSLEAMQKFLNGELTWAEIKNIPKSFLRQLAQIAYDEFKMGKFQRAEILFKGLAVLDHNNWYYRAALGAVYQKQGLAEQAIGEYDIALTLNPQEVTSLVNRGQCHLQLKDTDAALQDFATVRALSLKADNPWLKRAETLSQTVLSKRK
jgi:tetratricopeptide (TPR) repeat protein